MEISKLLSYAYAALGPSFKGATEAEPFGVLPTPVRTALLTKLRRDVAGLEVDFREETLTQGQAAGRPYQWISGWRADSSDFKEQLFWAIQNHNPARSFSGLDEFIRAHGLVGPEHVAERRFLEEVFVPELGEEALGLLVPQFPFEDEDGRERRADFLLQGIVPYAIEIEGRRYHDETGKGGRFAEEKLRQRGLALENLNYFPIAYGDLVDGRARRAFRALIDRDARLKSRSPRSKRRWNFDGWMLDFPTLYPHYLFAAFGAVARAVQAGEEELNLREEGPSLPLLETALADAYLTLHHVARIFGQGLKLPRVRLNVISPKGDYLEMAGPFRNLLSLWAGPTSGLEVVEDAQVPGVRVEVEDLARFARDSFAEPLWPYRLGRNPEPQALHFFARKHFAVPELRRAQIELLRHALRGDSGLGLLPTGYGKSLIFQLYALLVPGVNIVISPLLALMRDQIYGLRRVGIRAAEAITSDDVAGAKEAKADAFFSGRYRILYLSPERLRIKGFIERFRERAKALPVSAITVDEAHCVSEWGHDFRPAYLHIGKFHRALEEASGDRIPLIALTATASQIVRQDIVSVLGLPEGSVQQLQSSDRPNLSFSVHAVSPGAEAKREAVLRLLNEVVPRALKRKGSSLIGKAGSAKAGNYVHAGVVFAIYADPHSKTGLHEGVHAIARHLRESLYGDPQASQVEVYASRPPQLCPGCGSPEWVNASGKKRCLLCGHEFEKPKRVSDREWGKRVRRAQDGFQENRFPLLVATKGYGMGIDKRNLRFIIHHSLASGLEGYYQEAGRAGRDGQHSHVALMYVPPAEGCREEHIGPGASSPPPCVMGNGRFKKCPYDLSSPCDYARQTQFLAGQYPGVEKSVGEVAALFERYGLKGNGRKQEIRVRGEREANRVEYALVRLMQIGALDDYVVEYLGTASGKRFHLAPLRLDEEHIRSTLKSVLAATRLGDKEISRRLGQISPGLSPEALAQQAVRVLIERIYETVLPMRYQMLRNEIDYADSEKKGRCRRRVIRSIFDDAETLPGDDYRCGFCDVCAPDLDFRVAGAHLPERDYEAEEIVRRIPSLLERFSLEEADEIVAASRAKNVTRSVMLRAEHHLERDATNLGALYLAGTFRAEEDPPQGVEYFLRSFHEALRQGLDLVQSVRFIADAAVYDHERPLDEAFATPDLQKYEARKALTLALEDRAGFDHPGTRLTFGAAQLKLALETTQRARASLGGAPLASALADVRALLQELEEVA